MGYYGVRGDERRGQGGDTMGGREVMKREGAGRFPWKAWLLHCDPEETTGLNKLNLGFQRILAQQRKGDHQGLAKPKCYSLVSQPRVLLKKHVNRLL